MSIAAVRTSSEPTLPCLSEVRDRAPESVLVRLADASEIEGLLTGFSARQGRIEITSGGQVRSIDFAQLQWVRFTRPVDFSRSAEAFKRGGMLVEALPAPSGFALTFVDGHVLTGELRGYGAELGCLGLYLADGNETYRLFAPVPAITSFAVGERLGTLLLERTQLTHDGLELALERQRELRKQHIGGLLLERRLVSRAQLEEALEQQASKPLRPLGEALVQLGAITQDQLDAVLAEQRRNRRKPIGEILVGLNLIDRETLRDVLAQKLGVPFVDLRKYAFEPSWADLAPYPVCRQNRMVPLYRANGALTVALDDPLDTQRLGAIAFAVGSAVIPVLASAEDIAWALEMHPERRMWETLDEAAAGEGVEPTAAELEGEDAQSLVSKLAGELGTASEAMAEQRLHYGDSTLVRLVNKIITDAHASKCSDIHFEPGNGRERLRVRFRRDGMLFDYLTLSSRFRPAIVSRLKLMANLDISEHRHAQDGKIDFRRFGGLALELRVACIPTQHGLEAIVLRLLTAVKPMPLAKIGLSPQVLAQLRGLAEKPHGLILVCGPTGSGKTTTLHSLLAHLNTPDTKIWTAEDPVEITQPGLNQVQVQPNIGWTFATALRSFLRADPDVIMVGEVRDIETARIVVESSLTGHLVLTTLHTNSAPECVTRLVDIGIDPFNFTDALLGALAQRLTRRLCARCRKMEPASEAALLALAGEHCQGSALDPAAELARWRAAYAVDGAVCFAMPSGCKACNGTGFAGRLALYELLVATPEIKRLILQHATVDQLVQLGIAEGMRTLKQDGIEKVLQGLTTIEQVRAVSG
jgi:type II secretory ATPase GspE/PulE/Tfp pilus assembly ATPase PilB-like protein